ncbi:MAG: magnesium transporter [Clostridiales bacterium]|jgi:magnesium transporter|nr:magnesium transporter [Clostridiales bacterium]
MNESNTEKLLNQILESVDGNDLQKLNTIVEQSNSFEILSVIQMSKLDVQLTVFEALSPRKKVEVFEQLDITAQLAIISAQSEENKIQIVNGMQPDDRVNLFVNLPLQLQESLMNSLTKSEQEVTVQLMRYSKNTAGRLMTPKFVELSGDMTVSSAIQKIKLEAKDKESINTAYIVDENGQIKGTTTLRQLLSADSDWMLDEIMDTKVVKVYTDSKQREIVQIMQTHDLLDLPVVSLDERIVGIITVDDALDIQEEQTTMDYFDKVGILSLRKCQNRISPLLKCSVLKLFWARLPYLVLALIGGLAVSAILGKFEIISNLYFAVAFVPLVLNIASLIGLQSLAIYKRAVSLRQIDGKNFKSYVLKEIMVGLFLGFTLGVISAIVVYGWSMDYFADSPFNNSAKLAMVIGLALIICTVFVSMLGVTLPYFLSRIKLDKLAVDPILLVLKDISCLCLYFLVYGVLMGNFH